jgi:uncharacterized membrane protein
MLKQLKHRLFKYLEIIWAIFLNGLFAILPLTLTIALFNFSIRLLKNWLEPIYRLEPAFLHRIPHSEVFLVILVIFAIGTILHVFILRSLLHWVEYFIARLPLVRPIYAGIKQLVSAFSMQDKLSFKQVVLVEFPIKGIYSLGFMTNEMASEITPKQGKKYFNIFIPTTPNPTSGFFVMVPEEDALPTDLTRQEAMALIISGGIIQPERFIKKRTPRDE